MTLETKNGNDATRAAENQSLVREVNDRISELNEVFDQDHQLSREWICECANENCFESKVRRGRGSCRDARSGQQERDLSA
jgi:hypothetical protein